MIKAYLTHLIAASLLAAAGSALWRMWPHRQVPGEFHQVSRPPRLTPDYAGIVFPPNIAPLNFVVQEPGVAYRVRLQAAHGKPVEVASKTPAIPFPPRAWRALLDQNREGYLVIDVCVHPAAGLSPAE